MEKYLMKFPKPSSRRVPGFVVFPVFACFSVLSCSEATWAQGVRTPSPVRCVYFVPADMEPVPDRHERLGRVMSCVRDFYRNGMQEHGYGPMTFALEWKEPGKLVLYEVRGRRNQDRYGRNDADVVRNEVRETLRSKYGINANEEVLVIFQMLLKRDGETSTELGPYVGGGSHLAGTAWVYEDARLDADLLPSKEPGGYYNRPCSLGQFNTHYIGGMAHELGHAFGLPHACELDGQRKTKGRALMGAGNHTFGRELRDEGPGTFLCASSALRLSRIRAFVGDFQGSRERVYWVFEHLQATAGNTEPRSVVLEGRVSAMPRLLGIIAYNDDATVPADYDAKTWTAPVAGDGSFKIEIGELKNVPYQLRLVGVHANGGTSRLVLDYTVEAEKIDLSSINIAVPLDNLKRLFGVANRTEIEEIGRKYLNNPEIRRRAEHLARLLQMSETVDVARLPEDVRETDLSGAEFVSATTGWGNFRRAHVPEDVFLQVGGVFFDSGLYAHAPSSYKIELAGTWKALDIGYGLQDGHDGPVRFVIRGDGKELFRSDVVKDHQERRETLSVENVKMLELAVESAAPNGNSGAWGVWVKPMLKR